MSSNAPSEIVLFEEPFLRITSNVAHRWIRLTWNGHARSDQYRHGLTVALEFMEAHKEVRYWIADLREMTAIMQADEKWANETWFPRLFSTGLERMAIIASKDYFNQTSVERSFTAVQGQLTFEVAWFRTAEEALEWIGGKALVM